MPQFLSQTKAKVIFQSAQCWIIDGFIAFNLLNNTTLTSMVWSEPFVKSSAQESLFCGKNEKFHEIQYLKLGYFWATCQAISQFHIYDLRLGYKYPPEYEFPLAWAPPFILPSKSGRLAIFENRELITDILHFV